MLIGFGLFLAGVVFTLVAVLMLLKRRVLLAGLNGTAGFSLLSMATVFVLILLNIHTYHQLTSEIKLAEVEVGKRTHQGTPIKVQTTDNHYLFIIDGQEWQLDARFLKWKSWAYLLGSEPVVRLEGLTGRRPLDRSISTNPYHPIQQSQILQNLGSTLSDWLGIVDTYYGSSVYMPASEGAVYTVSATVTGLVARAENNVAKQAVTRWMSN